MSLLQSSIYRYDVIYFLTVITLESYNLLIKLFIFKLSLISKLF